MMSTGEIEANDENVDTSNHLLNKPLGEIGKQIRQLRHTVQNIAVQNIVTAPAPSSSSRGTGIPNSRESNGEVVEDQRLYELESMCKELNEELQELRQIRNQLHSSIISTTNTASPAPPPPTTLTLTPIKPTMTDSIHILTPILKREWNEPEPEPVEYELGGEHTQLAAQITTVMKEITALRMQQAAEKERQRQTFGCFYDDVSMQWTPMPAFAIENSSVPTSIPVPASVTVANHHQTSYTTPYTVPNSAPFSAPSSSVATSSSSGRISQTSLSSSCSKNLSEDIGIGPHPTPLPGSSSGSHVQSGHQSGSSQTLSRRIVSQSDTASSSRTTGGSGISKKESALAIHEELIRIRHEIYRLQTPETNAVIGTMSMRRNVNAGRDCGSGNGDGVNDNAGDDVGSSRIRGGRDRNTHSEPTNLSLRDREPPLPLPLQQLQQTQQDPLQQEANVSDYLSSSNQPQQQSQHQHQSNNNNNNNNNTDNSENDTHRLSNHNYGTTTKARARSRSRSIENITHHLLEEVIPLPLRSVDINSHGSNGQRLLDNVLLPTAVTTITTANNSDNNSNNNNAMMTMVPREDGPHESHDKQDPDETIAQLRQEVLHLQQLLKATKSTVKIKHEETIAARMEAMSAREHVLRLQEELTKYQQLPVQSSQLVHTSISPSDQPSTSINPTSTQHKDDNVDQTDADAAIAAAEAAAKAEASAVAKLQKELQEVAQQLLRSQSDLSSLQEEWRRHTISATQDKADFVQQLQRKESALMECQRFLADTKQRANDAADASSTCVIEMKDRYHALHVQHVACGEALDEARAQLQQKLQHHERVCQQHADHMAAAALREQSLLRQVQSLEASKEHNEENLRLVLEELQQCRATIAKHQSTSELDRQALARITSDHLTTTTTTAKQFLQCTDQITSLTQQVVSAQLLLKSTKSAFEVEKVALLEQNQRILSQITALEKKVITLEQEKNEAGETIRGCEKKYASDKEAWLAMTTEKDVSMAAMSTELADIRSELAFCRRHLAVNEEQSETARLGWSAEKTALETDVAMSMKTIDALRQHQQEGLERQNDLERKMAKAEQDHQWKLKQMKDCGEKEKEREAERKKEQQRVIQGWEEKYHGVIGELEVSTRQGKEWEYRLRASEAETSEALRQVDATNGALINAQMTLKTTQNTLSTTQESLQTTQQRVDTLQQALEASQIIQDQAMIECRKTYEHELEMMRGKMSEVNEERQEMNRRLMLSTTESKKWETQVVVLQSQLREQQQQQHASETRLKANVDELHSTIDTMKATATSTSTTTLGSLRASLQSSEIARLEAEHAYEQSTSRLHSLEMENKGWSSRYDALQQELSFVTSSWEGEKKILVLRLNDSKQECCTLREGLAQCQQDLTQLQTTIGDENRRLKRDLDAATSAYHTQIDRSAVSIKELQNTLKLQQQQLQQQQQQNEHQQKQQQLLVVQLNQQSQAREHETMLIRLVENDKQIDQLTALVEQTTMQLTALQETQNITVTQHDQLASQHKKLSADDNLLITQQSETAMQLNALRETHTITIAQHDQLTSQHEQLSTDHNLLIVQQSKTTTQLTALQEAHAITMIQHNRLSSQHEQLSADHNLLITQQSETAMQLNSLQETHNITMAQHDQLASQHEQLIEKERETAIQMQILKEERTTMSHRHLEIEQENAKEIERLLEQVKEKEGKGESLVKEFREMQLHLQQQLLAKDEALAIMQQQLSEEQIRHKGVSNKLIELMEEVNERDGAVIQMHHDMTVLQGCVSERDSAIVQLQQDISVLQECVEERNSALKTARRENDGVIAHLKHGMSVLQECVNERDGAIIQLHHDVTILQGCVNERDMQINEARINAAEETKAHMVKIESLQSERCAEESVWQSRLLVCEGSIEKLTRQCASLQEERMHQDQAMFLLKIDYEEEKERHTNIMQAVQHQYEEEKGRLEADDVANIDAARITALKLEAADIALAEHKREMLLLTDRLEMVQTALDHEKYTEQALQETNNAIMAQHDRLNFQHEQLTSEHQQVISRYEQLTVEYNQLIVQQQETQTKLNALQETHNTTIAQYNQLQTSCRKQQIEYEAAAQSHERQLLVLDNQLQEQHQLQASLRDQLQQQYQHQQHQQQQVELQQRQQETVEESCRQELAELEHRLQQMTIMLTTQQERYDTEIEETKKINAEWTRERQGLTETVLKGRIELDDVRDQLTQLTMQLRMLEEEKHTIQVVVARYRAEADEMRTTTLTIREQHLDEKTRFHSTRLELEARILQQETLATQYLNRWERTQRELLECKDYLQTRPWEVKDAPQQPGQQEASLITTATATVNPDITATVTADAIASEAADIVHDVRNEDYIQEDNSSVTIINNNNNNNDNNSINPPVKPSPLILSHSEATATDPLLHQQIQSLQADLRNKEEEITRLEAHFRAELLRVEALVAEARKHARLGTVSTMQAESTAVITTAEDGDKHDGSDERKVVSVESSHNHGHDSNNNDNTASSQVFAQNANEQRLAPTRAREHERRVAQLERQLYVSEQRTKGLEQGLERQGQELCSLLAESEKEKEDLLKEYKVLLQAFTEVSAQAEEQEQEIDQYMQFYTSNLKKLLTTTLTGCEAHVVYGAQTVGVGMGVGMGMKMGVGATASTIHSTPKTFILPSRGDISNFNPLHDQRKINEMTKYGPSKGVVNGLHRRRFSPFAPRTLPGKYIGGGEGGHTGLSPVLSLFPPRPTTTRTTASVPTILPPPPPPARTSISTTTMTPPSSLSYEKHVPSSVISFGDVYPYPVTVTASQQILRNRDQRDFHRQLSIERTEGRKEERRTEERKNTLVDGMLTTPVSHGAQFTRPRGHQGVRLPGDGLMRWEDRERDDDGAVHRYGITTMTIGEGDDRQMNNNRQIRTHDNKSNKSDKKENSRGQIREDVLKRAEAVVRMMEGNDDGFLVGEEGGGDEDVVLSPSHIGSNILISSSPSSAAAVADTSSSLPPRITVDSSMQTDERFSTQKTPASKTPSSSSLSSSPPLTRSPPPPSTTIEAPPVIENDSTAQTPALAPAFDPPAQATTITIQPIDANLPLAPVSPSPSTTITSVDPYNTMDPVLAGITAAAAEDAVKVVMLSEDLRQLTLKYEEQTVRLRQHEVEAQTQNALVQSLQQQLQDQEQRHHQAVSELLDMKMESLSSSSSSNISANNAPASAHNTTIVAATSASTHVSVPSRRMFYKPRNNHHHLHKLSRHPHPRDNHQQQDQQQREDLDNDHDFSFDEAEVSFIDSPFKTYRVSTQDNHHNHNHHNHNNHNHLINDNNNNIIVHHDTDKHIASGDDDGDGGTSIVKELRNLHIALCHAKVENEQLRSSKAIDDLQRQHMEEEKERYAMFSEELYRSLCLSQNSLEKQSADAIKVNCISAEKLAALSARDDRIDELEKRLALATVKSAAAVMTALTAAQQEAAVALSLAVATTQQEADIVIGQLRQDMSALQERVDERDSALVIVRQEADGVISQLQHDIMGLQQRVEEREDVIVRLDHNVTVLQGCVDESNIALTTAQQEADLCILQMDDQLRLARAEIAALLQQQKQEQQQREEEQQKIEEQQQQQQQQQEEEQQLVIHEYVEQLQRIREMVCIEREEQRAIQQRSDEEKERYAMYAEELYGFLWRELQALTLVKEETKDMLVSVHLQHREQLRCVEERAREKEQALRHDVEAYSADIVGEWEHRVSVLQGCLSERDSAIIHLQQDINVLHGRVAKQDVVVAATQQETDNVIAHLKHDMSVLQECVNERDGAIIQLHHDVTILQGCVNERDMQINEARINAAEEKQAMTDEAAAALRLLQQRHHDDLTSIVEQHTSRCTLLESQLSACQVDICNLTTMKESLLSDNHLLAAEKDALSTANDDYSAENHTLSARVLELETALTFARTALVNEQSHRSETERHHLHQQHLLLQSNDQARVQWTTELSHTKQMLETTQHELIHSQNELTQTHSELADVRAQLVPLQRQIAKQQEEISHWMAWSTASQAATAIKDEEAAAAAMAISTTTIAAAVLPVADLTQPHKTPGNAVSIDKASSSSSISLDTYPSDNKENLPVDTITTTKKVSTSLSAKGRGLGLSQQQEMGNSNNASSYLSLKQREMDREMDVSEMQEEIDRTSRALHTLQTLLHDRDVQMKKKESLFLTEKNILLERNEQAMQALAKAKKELRKLKGEQEMMERIARDIIIDDR